MGKAKKAQKFPQKSQIITAKFDPKLHLRQVFLALMLGGLLFLVGLNLIAAYIQPPHLKELMKDPTNVAVLRQVVEQNKNPELNAFFEKYLATLKREDEVVRLRAKRERENKQLDELQKLLEAHPNYPDGYAYLAVLAYGLRECALATNAIDKALSLDPNRPVFQDLAQVIVDCR